MGDLAISQDPDEIPHDAFIKVCSNFKQVRITEKNKRYLFANYNLWPLTICNWPF